MDDLCRDDAEVFAEDEERQRKAKEPGAVLTGSPGGLVEGIPGLRELPVG